MTGSALLGVVLLLLTALSASKSVMVIQLYVRGTAWQDPWTKCRMEQDTATVPTIVSVPRSLPVYGHGQQETLLHC